MPEMPDWIAFLESLLPLTEIEDEHRHRIIEELALEMAQTYEDVLTAGASPAEAEERARGVVADPEDLAAWIVRSRPSRRVPGAERWLRRSEEAIRARRPAGSLAADLLQDLRYSLRTLRRSPGFLAVAVLTLGLGVGANTAIFSVVHGVLIRPLGYQESDRLVTLWQIDEAGTLMPTSPGNYADLRDRSTSCSAMAAFQPVDLTITGRGEPRLVQGIFCIDSVFDVLEVPALIGRTFTRDETGPASESAVVLSHDTWRTLFADEPDIDDLTITVNGITLPVIGVMPPTFHFPDEEAALWIASRYSDALLTVRTQTMLSVVARLADGVTLEQTRAELEALEAHLREADPMANEWTELHLVDLRHHLVGGVETRLLVLMGAVAFVLLIVCGNLANLLLARAARRQHEVASRLALGASRGRLLRQMLTEGGVLGLLGAAAGIGFGIVLLHLLLTTLPGDIPRVGQIGLHLPVLVFCLGLSLLAGLGFGIVPALNLPVGEAGGMLRRTAGDRRTSITRRLLIVTEVALATILLIGAGLMVHTLARLQAIDPGFNNRDTLTFEVTLPASRYTDYAQRVGFFDEVLDRLSRLPGTVAVAASEIIPTSGDRHYAWLNIEGRISDDNTSPPLIDYRSITPGYFETMQIPLIRGRGFELDDRSFERPVVVINESLARRFWPGEDPIGKRVTIGIPDDPLIPLSEIVGIAQDVRVHGMREEDTPAVLYAPYYNLSYRTYMTFIARTRGDPWALLPAVRAVFRDLDPDLPLFDIRTLDDVTGASIGAERSAALLLGLFAMVAMIVAAVGVFGIVAYTIGLRTRELGIRLALGATVTRVRSGIVRESMGTVLIGIALGLAGAAALTRLLAGLVYGISTTDPATFILTALLLTGVAWLAALLPVRRITRLDPVAVLRSE